MKGLNVYSTGVLASADLALEHKHKIIILDVFYWALLHIILELTKLTNMQYLFLK